MASDRANRLIEQYGLTERATGEICMNGTAPERRKVAKELRVSRAMLVAYIEYLEGEKDKEVMAR